MKTLLSSHKKRLENALNEAQYAFWSVIAEQYPEIKSGDMMPLDVFAFEEALEKGVIAWLDTNQEDV